MENLESENLENENLEQNLNKRDYDKEPLIIKNNFITYLNDLYAMLIVNSLWVYGVFYSGAIDWDNGEHLETFLTALHNLRLYEGTLIIFMYGYNNTSSNF